MWLKTELFKNRTLIECLKSIIVWIPDTYCTLINGTGRSEVVVHGLKYLQKMHAHKMEKIEALMKEFLKNILRFKSSNPFNAIKLD